MEDNSGDLGRYSSLRKESMETEAQPKVVLTPWERETHISWSDESQDCVVFTCNKSLWKQLESKGYTLVNSTETSRTYSCLKKHISFRSTVVTPRPPMTEEHKDKLRKARGNK